jgi:hypothetical protein
MYKWEDNMKINNKEIWCMDIFWIYLANDWLFLTWW